MGRRLLPRRARTVRTRETLNGPLDRARWSDPVVRTKRAAKRGDTTPVVILLHGRGADEDDLFDLARRLPAYCDYVSVRAPVPVEGGGYTWFENRGPAKPIATSLRASVRSFRAWLDGPQSELADRPCYLLGFSAGAMMAGALVLDDPKRFARAVLLSGVIALDALQHVVTDDRLDGLPVFLGYGTEDPFFPLAPPSAMLSTIAYLRDRSGAKLAEHAYAIGHGISEREVGEIAAWLSDSS